MEKLASLIENKDYEKAAEVFLEILENDGMTEELSIYGTLLSQCLGDGEGAVLTAQKGLAINNKNYELYLMMAQSLEQINVNQAFLTYENALYFAKRFGNEEEISVIEGAFCDFKDRLMDEVTVRPVSFVILSFNTLDFTAETLQSIRRTCNPDAYEVIYVDNNSTDGSLEWLKEQEDIVLVENHTNRGFPGGCNDGIKASKSENDIFLLNSDVTVTENALYTLRMGLYSEETIGSAGCCTTYSANAQMVDEVFDSVPEYLEYADTINVPKENAIEYKSWLVGFALLIKRPVLDEIGLLDERFNPGNYEDNDIGIRIALAGYKNALCWNSFIIHYGSKSFGKTGNYENICDVNKEKYKEKWGFDPDYFSYTRGEVTALIKRDPMDEITVLEVGCASGNSLSNIKYRYPNSRVMGVELADEVAKMAATKFPCLSADIEKSGIPYEGEMFDYVIFADVLEHLREPEETLLAVKKRLKPCGQIVISLPNVMNIKVVANLIRGDFTYEDSGVLDRTHLRFFTVKEVLRMAKRLGMYVVDTKFDFNKDVGQTIDDFRDVYDIIKTVPGAGPEYMFEANQMIFRLAVQ